MTTTPTRNPRGAGRPGRAPRPVGATVEAATRVQLRQANDTIDLLHTQLQEAAGDQVFGESAGIAQLERRITADPGWRLFSTLSEQEFSPEGLVQLRAVCRLMSLVNPLIKRGLDLKSVYVHGRGCDIRARANGHNKANPREQDVNAVIDAMISDPANQRAVFGQQAASEAERALGTDGEVFVCLYTRPMSGWVQARTFSADEITEVITNPDDRSEPWYYRRQWQRQWYDARGTLQYEPQEMLYPDVDYRPKTRPATFGGTKVDWFAPVIQVTVNKPLNWLRGIPDAYAAINWARAYKDFLEQWSSLMKSLSKFAWRLTTEGKNRAQARAAITAHQGARTTVGDDGVGATALTPMGATLEAIPKSGATIDAESGRPIAMMVAAALNVPVTMLLNDPGQTGARATAETLDRPTELGMEDRRSLWTKVRQRICQHAIRESVRAPQGRLKGTVKRDPVTDREIVTLAGDTDDTVEVNWPDLDDVEAKEIIDGVMSANGAGVIPPDRILRYLLAALGERDVESIVADMVDEKTGAFKWPQTAQSAAQAGAAGQVPAGGPPAVGPDGQPVDIPPGIPGQTGPDTALDAQGSAPVPADGVAGRMADADFGLFGSGAQPDPGPPPPAGAKPAPAAFDAAFFTVGARAAGGDQGAPDEQDEPMPDEQISEALAGRMGDADFGLYGSKPPDDDDDEDEPAGEKPPAGFYDPKFFTFDDD